LEWAVPSHWRQKFDLDNYVPTEGTRNKLVEACSALERFELGNKPPSNEKDAEGKKKDKKTGKKTNGRKQRATDKKFKYECTTHGPNHTHDTPDCWSKQASTKNYPKNNLARPKSFSNKGLRQELNALAQQKGSNKRKILELYASVITAEQAKLDRSAKPKKKAARRPPEPDSESDSTSGSGSVNAMSDSFEDLAVSSKIGKSHRILKNPYDTSGSKTLYMFRESGTAEKYQTVQKIGTGEIRKVKFSDSVFDDSGTRKQKKFRVRKKRAPIEIKEPAEQAATIEEKAFIQKVKLIEDEEMAEFNLEDVSVGSKMDTDEEIEEEKPPQKKHKSSKKSKEPPLAEE
jgi:hypothetical protein